MEAEIDLRKTLEENASDYFEKSKKAKKKLAGIAKAITDTEKRIEKLRHKKEIEREKSKPIKKRKQQWFEKFHWFFTSDNLLVVAGRDSKSNEIIVKKHMESGDLYFHADIHGAAHCVLKTTGNKAPSQSMKETAEFSAVNSRAWQQGVSSADIYSVLPSQVSKKAPSGEAIGTGAFMIYGERNWFRKTPLDFAVGIKKENSSHMVISGPVSAVKTHSLVHKKILQGRKKKGEIAKQLKKLFERELSTELQVHLDEFIAMLPAGGLELK